eukprot:TRINITY_DN16603_c0_g1_i1.p1 TRINITY_DN16603_c0_g1~~TRINITY_DN16603_c0_g1_i1.p1  ORF type:complete len:285 (-),score=69.83 TRINITY_DN16603_c0_g1_i1:505-1359(-)
MDVFVEAVEGAPEGSLLSIKGSSGPRRQSAVDVCTRSRKPLSLPTKADEDASLKVEVSKHLGSNAIMLPPRTEGLYTVTLGDGAAALVAIKEKVARKAAADTSYAQQKAPPTPCSPTSPAAGGSEVVAAKSYIEEHNLLDLMKVLVETVVRDQPGDPYALIAEEMAQAVTAAKAGSLAADVGLEIAALSAMPIRERVASLRRRPDNERALAHATLAAADTAAAAEVLEHYRSSERASELAAVAAIDQSAAAAMLALLPAPQCRRDLEALPRDARERVAALLVSR